MNKQVMPFGKYEGETLENIWNKDKSYIVWAIEKEINVVVEWAKVFNKTQRTVKSSNNDTVGDAIEKYADFVGGYNDFNGSVHPYVCGMGHDHL